ncbi:MAG: hypothetical protein IPP51_17610 [Bacteroidetes bacterium]|nr:hypothetical protein [Bacteroidota bacterium]
MGATLLLVKSSSSFGSFWDEIYLVRTDSVGNVLWSKTYSGTGDNTALSLDLTVDGGYIITGETYDNSGIPGDLLLMKVDSLGVLSWANAYGGSDEDKGWSVRQSADNGYFVAGYTFNTSNNNSEIYFLKTDANGISGCNESVQVLQEDTAATITGSPNFTISSRSFVTAWTTYTGSGITINTPLHQHRHR